MVHRTIHGAASGSTGDQAAPLIPLGAPQQRWYDVERHGHHTTVDVPADRIYEVEVSVTVRVAVYAEEAWDALHEGEDRVRAVADRIAGEDRDLRALEVQGIQAEVQS